MKLKTFNKIYHLFLHAQSAVGYGNRREARLYYRQIIASRKKHGIAKRDLKNYLRSGGKDSAKHKSRLNAEPLFSPESKMFRRRRVIWEEVMAKVLADYFKCELLINRFNNLKAVCGTPDNRRSCKESFLFLYKSAKREADEYADCFFHDADFQETRAQRQNIVLSFLTGFASGLESRLNFLSNAVKSIDEYDRERRTEFNPQALILKTVPDIHSDKSSGTQPVKDFGEQKNKTKFVMLDSCAYFAGMAAGAQIALTEELALTENITLSRWSAIERERSEQRIKQRRLEEMRFALNNSRGRGRRRQTVYFDLEREEPPMVVKPFAGVQQSLRFE